MARVLTIKLSCFQKLVDARGEKEYYVRGTFTNHNLDFSDDVFSMYDAGFDQISIEPVVCDASKEYAITERDLPAIFKGMKNSSAYSR